MTTQPIDVVTFRLGGERIAIPAELLREILEPVRVTRVPTAHRFAEGLVNVRGSVVPLTDLRVPFCMPSSEETPETRFLVLDLSVGDGALTVAISADKVETVTRLDPQEIGPIPEVGTLWPPEYVRGICKMDEDFVLLPDLHRIFHDFTASGEDHRKDLPK
ncbi:MAG TPA: chemotaxis protein CheW [Rhizobium sp.]|nr:chemotaxis protein CheW [Rhizobium sp.]